MRKKTTASPVHSPLLALRLAMRYSSFRVRRVGRIRQPGETAFMEILDAYPTSYILDADNQRLILTWSDGHESIHPYELLRRSCPCALCAGEGNIPGQMTPDTPLSSVETDLFEIKPVGRYGLSPVWGDGHHTGIFTYEKLRAECQCDECRASARSQSQQPRKSSR